MNIDIYAEEINNRCEQHQKRLESYNLIQSKTARESAIRAEEKTFSKEIKEIEMIQNTEVRAMLIRQFVEECNINRVGKYFYSKSNGGNNWVSEDERAIRYKTLLIKSSDFNTLLGILEETGRVYDKVGYSVEPEYGVLNLFNNDNWVYPAETDAEIDPIFEVLINSISNGNIEAQRHIEKCLLRKVYNPGDSRIPALVWNGEGNVGKGLFVDILLNTIFGNGTASVRFSEIDNFNGLLVGKMVVNIDESGRDNNSMNTLKRFIGNKTIGINQKNKDHFVINNLIWWMISSNNEDGSIRIRGGGEDRRWSIITVSKPITWYIQKQIGVELIGSKTQKDPNKWLDDHVSALSNSHQVSAWLYKLLLKHGIQEYTPREFHSSDYQNQIEQNKSIEEQLCDRVFRYGLEEFSAIRFSDLYKFYQNKCSSKAYAKSDSAFGRYIKKYLIDNNMFDTKWGYNRSGIESRSRFDKKSPTYINLVRQDGCFLTGSAFDDLTIYSHDISPELSAREECSISF